MYFHILWFVLGMTLHDSILVMKITKSALLLMLIGAMLSIIAGALSSWWFCVHVEKKLKRLRYEMDLIAEGNIDVEIQAGRSCEEDMLKDGLKLIQEFVKQSKQQMDDEVNKRTKELSSKVVDLEKARDVMTESVLLAKKIQQERDQLLLQLKQMSIRKDST
jgi:hypothetical protein